MALQRLRLFTLTWLLFIFDSAVSIVTKLLYLAWTMAVFFVVYCFKLVTGKTILVRPLQTGIAHLVTKVCREATRYE